MSSNVNYSQWLHRAMNGFRSLKYPFTNFFNRGFDASMYIKLLAEVDRQKHTDDDSESICINENAISLHKNNDIAASITKSFRREVIGDEINLQFRSSDEAFNREAEALFAEFSEVENFEISGRYYRGLMERAMIKAEILEGGFIIRHHYNDAWKFGYKIEIIPLNMIDANHHDPENNNINGFELDKYNNKKAVWIYTNYLKEKSVRVLAKHLTFHIIPEFELNQISGVSLLSPAIRGIDMLSDYEASELISSKVRSDNKIVVKTNSFAELKTALKRTKGDLTPSMVTDLYDTYKIKESQGISYIPKEDDVQNLSTLDVSIFDPLEVHKKKTISSSIGLSSQTTVRDLPSSYNASLLALQMDDKEFSLKLKDLVELTLKEIYGKRFIDAIIIKGLIKTPKDYWKNPREWRKLQYMRKSSKNLDPVKDSKANSEDINNGLGSPIQKLGEMGIDWQTHIDDIARFKDYCESKGVEFNLNKENEPQPIDKPIDT